MSTELTVLPITTIAEKIEANLPRIQRGNEIAIKVLKEIQATEVTDDETRDAVITRLTKVRDIYAKVNEMRVEITQPLDQIKDYLMSFERPLDDKGKDNEYALAKAVVTSYDQKKIDEKKKAELAAEMQRQVAVYKAEIKSAVGKQLAEMFAGIKKTMLNTMAQWEKSVTMENYDHKLAEINKNTNPVLNEEKYNACFHTDFNKRHILNDELTKEYIESLKQEKELSYRLFNTAYISTATEIKNEYRAKMPAIKQALLDAKDNAEKEAARKTLIDKQDELRRKEVESELATATTAIENQKDMNIMEATFVEQATTQDLNAGPVKIVAEFVSDRSWLVPLLDVIGKVATSGKITTIRKKNGDYIDAIGWWLAKFAETGKEVNGIALKETAKTIVRRKKEEEV